MQILSFLVAFALVVLGADWILKWLGVLPGDIVGQTQWALYGAALVIGGLLLMLWAGRRYDV